MKCSNKLPTKKVISFLSALSLVLSLICSFPAVNAAGNTPLKVRAVTEYTSWRIGFTGRSCYPIDGIQVSGEQIDASLEWNTEEENISAQSAHVMVFNEMSEALADTSGILIYLSVPQANTVAISLNLEMPDSSRWNKTYVPAMSLKVDKACAVCEIGSDAWQSKTVVPTNGDSKYAGGIRFDEAFEGYIKIPYASLANDNPAFSFDTQLDTVTSVAFRFKRAGGEYGQMIAGPIFWITQDSDSAEIEFPQECYAKTKISAAAVTNFTRNSVSFTVSEELCNDDIPVNGWRLSRAEVSECEQTEVSKYNQRLFILDKMGLSLEGAEGIILYVNLQSENTLAPTMTFVDPMDTTRWKYSGKWAPEFSLYVGEEFQYLEDGTDKWQSKTVVSANGDSNYKGGIYFDKAFSGYIRIPLTSFRNDSGFKPDYSLDIVSNFAVRFQRAGGTYGDILLGPLMVDLGGDGAELDVKPFVNIKTAENIEHGSVTVNKSAAISGQTLVFTVTADEGYVLKADGLRVSYSDFYGLHNDLVYQKEGNEGNTFSFVMPATDEFTVTAAFVEENTLNFAMLDSCDDQNNIRFTTRIYESGTSCLNAGLLLTQQRLLAGQPLTHNVSDIQVLDIPLNVLSDESEPSDEAGVKYRDYSILLSDILSENTDKTYVARAYVQLSEGHYEYADAATASLAELTAASPFADKLYRASYSDAVSTDCTSYRMNLSYTQTAYPSMISGRNVKAQLANSSYSCDYSAEETDKSVYWYKSVYDGFSLKGITHIMFYVSVPDTKVNYLSLTFGCESDTSEYYITSAKPYQLLEYGSDNWEHLKTVRGSTVQKGNIVLPAGFSGFVKIPVSSITPTVADTAQFKNTVFRFSYIGTGEEAVYTGPIIGIRSDTDTAEEEITVANLPTATTELKAEAPENGDLSDTHAMLYWQACENAAAYEISAYRVEDVGYTLEKTATVYSNSGSVTGLTPDTDYAFVVTALNSKSEVVAVYADVRASTLSDNPLSAVGESGNITYDSAAATPAIYRTYTALSANNSVLLDSNPNRGFRGVIEFYHYNISDAEIRSTIESAIRKVNKYHTTDTYVVYFYLGDYANCALDDEVMAAIETAFEYFREKKMQILLRFAYTDYHIFNDISGPKTETILNHISQLGPLVRKYTDIYHVVQAGFVGYFGEWHGDKQNVDRASILNSFMQLLCPENIYAQVRRPIFKDLIDDSASYKNRVGFHIDSYFGIMDATELGSSGYSYGLPEWNTQVETGSYTPNDAELYWFTQFIDSGIYAEGYASLLGASQLHLTTLSALNGYLDQGPDTDGCMVRWKALPVTEKWLSYNGIPYSAKWFKNADGSSVSRSVFDYINEYIGYRISAVDLTTSCLENSLDVSLRLKNYGTSSAFNLTGELVLLDSDGNVIRAVQTSDPSTWYPRNPDNYYDTDFPLHTVSGSFEMPTESGTYKIALRLSNSIGSTARLDNNIPYENGYNILHEFTS